ncbi:acyltransferase domain-containing protein [Saccharothrix sp. Mg75]|uniref:acyltransferase domain-containing protein n=1 Tax=Saccharothrix sp. Mg75 TaxID=3445357 RepID=UPI003EE86EE3
MITRAAPVEPGTALPTPFPHVLPLSAPDPAALTALAGEYADLLDAHGPETVCRTAAERAHHPCRGAVVGRDSAELAAALRALPTTGSGPRPGPPDRVVFVFPGQGAQRAGMGRELLAAGPVVAEALDECDAAVARHAGWSLLDAVRGSANIEGEGRVQPVLWALQVALAALWRHWGVAPDAVIGHSMGEIAAAVTAGALTVDHAAALVCVRGELLESMADSGDMWAVQADERTARAAVAPYADRVFVAAVNSDHFVTLCGDPAALVEVVEPLLARKVFCRKLKAGAASHSPRVASAVPELVSRLTALEATDTDIPMYSTVLARVVRGPELGAAYWAAHLCSPVLFAAACRAAAADARRPLFVELGPQAALTASVEDLLVADHRDGTVLPSARRDVPDAVSLATSVGLAHVAGYDPDWRRVAGTRESGSGR